MRVVKHWVREDELVVYPISDIHIGSKDFDKTSEAKLRGYISYVADKPNARIVLVGDILNCASRHTTGSPHDQVYGVEQQIEKAVELFTPVADKIVAVSEGWHEDKARDDFGFTPTTALCAQFTPKLQYMGFSGVVVWGVGTHARGERDDSPAITYVTYQHHTTGGGTSLGSKIERINKLRSIVANADVYIGAHNHAIGSMPVDTFVVDVQNGSITALTQYLVDSGGYVRWIGSYAEKMQLPPLHRGSPRILFKSKGRKKDIDVTIS